MNRGLFKSYLRSGKKVRVLHQRRQPDAIRRRYEDRIKGAVLEDVMDLVREHVVPELERWAEDASEVARADASDKDLGEAIDTVAEELDAKWPRGRLARLIRPVGESVERWSRTQTNNQLRPSVGVDVFSGAEEWLKPAMDEFVRENVALVKSIPTQFLDDLERTVSRELADGARFEKLAEIIEERYGVAQARAELIARDQVGKFNADLDAVRQQRLGVTKYVWRTNRDERVRPEHAARDGETFEWASPPEDGHPGEAIGCRCSAEAVLSDLLDE